MLQLMIVDDRYTIIGSSNINDRSMLGSRDSEIAVENNSIFHRSCRRTTRRRGGCSMELKWRFPISPTPSDSRYSRYEGRIRQLIGTPGGGG